MRFSRVYLEITNVCNLRCGFCPGTERGPRFLSPAEFSLILKRLRGWTEYLYFHLMGEPLVHPQLAELLSIAAQDKYYVNLTTNGTLLSLAADTALFRAADAPLSVAADMRFCKVSDALLKAPALHRVNISLQAWEGNGCAWDVNYYVNSCADFAERAAARGVLVSFRLWNGEAAGNPALLSALKRRFPPPWRPGQKNVELSERVFLERAEPFDWPDAAGPARAGSFCRGLRDHIGVLCDGTVVPCCLDGAGALALGNLLEQPLEEILETPRAKAIYEGFSRRAPVEDLCRHCGYAERFG